MEDSGPASHQINEEINSRISQLKDSGDTGQITEQDDQGMSDSNREVQDQSLQTDSKTSVFRNKELVDQGQQTDFSDSANSSATSLRKHSQCSSYGATAGHESRRSTQ